MPKRNGTAAGLALRSKSDSGLNLQKVFFARMAGSKGGIPL